MPRASESIGLYPPRRRAWSAVTIFGLAALLSYTDRQILSLLVDPIRHDLHISDTQLSILQGAAFAVLYSFIGLPLGRVADMIPRRALLLFAVITWSLGTAVCGFSQSFASIFGARLLVGLGEAALAPAAMSLIGDYFPPAARAAPTGVFLTGMVIGGGAAVAIGGFLLSAAMHGVFAAVPVIGHMAPWRNVLVILGAAGLGVATLLLTLHEPPGRHASLADIRARLFDLHDFLAAFRLHYGVLLPLYGAMAIGSVVDYALMSWTPALLARRFALSPDAIGAGLGAVAVAAGLLATPLGGFVADRVAQRYGPLARIRLCAAVLVFGALGAPVGLIGSPAAVLACVFAWVFVSSLSGTVGIATTLDLLPHEGRGLGTATIAFCNTIIGLGLGPTLVAVATDRLYRSPAAVGLALSTVAAPAIALCFLLFFVASRTAQRRRLAIA